MVASRVPPTEYLARNQDMCPDWELNWQSFGLQAGTQSTESHQPGVNTFLKIYMYFLERGEEREKEKDRNMDMREKH